MYAVSPEKYKFNTVISLLSINPSFWRISIVLATTLTDLSFLLWLCSISPSFLISDFPSAPGIYTTTFSLGFSSLVSPLAAIVLMPLSFFYKIKICRSTYCSNYPYSYQYSYPFFTHCFTSLINKNILLPSQLSLLPSFFWYTGFCYFFEDRSCCLWILPLLTHLAH